MSSMAFASAAWGPFGAKSRYFSSAWRVSVVVVTLPAEAIGASAKRSDPRTNQASAREGSACTHFRQAAAEFFVSPMLYRTAQRLKYASPWFDAISAERL